MKPIVVTGSILTSTFCTGNFDHFLFLGMFFTYEINKKCEITFKYMNINIYTIIVIIKNYNNFFKKSIPMLFGGRSFGGYGYVGWR